MLGQLADWQQSIGESGRRLTTATDGRSLPRWPTYADHTTLIEAVARHHHHANLLATTVGGGG
ncbi:hypothetical protein ACH4A7_29985 [Streptomyces cyaneofuscatus]|uniref:hypothetical protein n=1 Tax=Streptomyces cyaneofuscatus TaxID=66883 RepID=UPI00378AB261